MIGGPLALLLEFPMNLCKSRRIVIAIATFSLFGLVPSSQAGDNITKRMQEFAEAKQFSGSVTLVASQGKVVHLEAVGLADIATKQAMTKDSIFAIASMTKPITATALMILQDEGKLSVDDPVAKYIPQFKDVSLADGPAKTEMTILHLMTHTSGLGGEQQCIGSIKQTVEELATRKLSFEPGTKWQYSPGLNVCGRIIEVVSGQAYEKFLAERIFEPLKMVDTTFTPNESQRERIAKLYQPSEEKPLLALASHWITDLSGDVVPTPSGGLFSTASDMAAFYQMILNGGELDGKRIVSAAAVKQMTAIQTGELATGFTPGNGWGLGWCVVREPQGVTATVSPGTFGHGGAFGTQGWVDPKTQTIYVLMIQRTKFGNGDGSDIRGEFHRLAAECLRN
jgi:CubicO group peptidase (beta-lactamase class C family)